MGNLGLGGRAGVVRRRTGRLGASQAHLSYRDAAFGTDSPRAAADGGEPQSRSGGQPQRPEELARSQGRRTLGPRQGTRLSKTSPDVRVRPSWPMGPPASSNKESLVGKSRGPGFDPGASRSRTV